MSFRRIITICKGIANLLPLISFVIGVGCHKSVSASAFVSSAQMLQHKSTDSTFNPFVYFLLQSGESHTATIVDLQKLGDWGQIKCLDTDLQLYQWKVPVKWLPHSDSILHLSPFNNGKWKIQKGSNVVRRIKQPNDPDYSLQLHLPMIQMPQAWEIGTNSVTQRGDTAIIAIIDDGVDTGHVDLKNNLWHNPKEIPWNGIDEDGNGYVDDYYGWNGGDQNPIIFNSQSTLYGHGTMVASVMAAAGNNAKGLSGLFWNTKLMVTHCYPTDFTPADIGVVNAMVYIYKQKKLYVKSNGSKGANVVAVNMSVGVDQGTVQEFPIWCSMYDSFASVGIMCAASTTNANYDVGIKGDIPSLCPSNALLIASSTDVNKQHVGCGYSLEHVDIATLGEGMYMARPEKGSSYPYQYESGTSFCSPQITATLAWIYARSCNLYQQLMKENPDSAISLMRSWLLNGVEKNGDLEKYTVSGGFLQVYNSWNLMHQWCNRNDTSYHFTPESNKIVGLMPNPIISNEVVTVRFTSSSDNPIGWSLTDFMGRTILPLHFTGSYFHGNDIDELKFRMPSDVAAGNYIWNLHFNNNKTIPYRVVVLK